MSDILEFLDGVSEKKEINFPLLKELIQLLKKYKIINHKVYGNVVRFKFKCRVYKIEYHKLYHDCFYVINVDNNKYSYVLWPKEFILGLDMHYLGSIECKEFTQHLYYQK